ncbi:MAG: 50S ribosomal protein L9, partial [Nitrosospira sp.]|nr:50S ribosomal protein L9 [Nitrosospira sp.]
IAEALKEQGFERERSMIRIPQGSLKQVGDYPLTIALHSDVQAHIVVSVLGEAGS